MRQEDSACCAAQRAASGGELAEAQGAGFRLLRTAVAETEVRCPMFGSSSVRSQVALPSGVKILTTGSKLMAPACRSGIHPSDLIM
jgi:hypothetical protein